MVVNKPATDLTLMNVLVEELIRHYHHDDEFVIINRLLMKGFSLRQIKDTFAEIIDLYQAGQKPAGPRTQLDRIILANKTLFFEKVKNLKGNC